jgi:hypothetical protein
MKNFATLILAACLCGAAAAQGPTTDPWGNPIEPINGPEKWGENHPEETHPHTNGEGHFGENSPHHGWGHGHHRPRHEPEDPNCPRPGEPVPEPGTMLLMGTGLAGAAILRRRKAAAAAAAEANAKV